MANRREGHASRRGIAKKTSMRASRGKLHATSAGLVAGPKKRILKPNPPSARLNTHKARSVWFQSRAAWPVREAPVSTLVSERARTKPSADLPGVALWEPAGPSNIGGRMTCLVCHPTQPDHIWAGSAGGGVWESTDAGKTWKTTWHDQDILNIGSLAIDLQKPTLIYCGTGEANLSADSYPGVGIFRSTNSGKDWALLADCGHAGVPRRIGCIATNPFDSSHIHLGGVGLGEVSASGQDHGGLYVSRDGGSTWNRDTFISSKNYWCHAIVFDATRQGTVYVTVTEQGARNGIWRSRDGGTSWTQLLKGLPPPERFGRTSLAVSASNSNVLYAFASDEGSGRSDLLLGVFKSDNGGDSWTNVAGIHFNKEGQISYGNTIAIHPTDPNTVICGGVDLHITKNAGKSWAKATRWDLDRGKPGYAHADHHAVVMPGASVSRVYSANDGGVDVSSDGGKTWTNRSNGLPVTMFYDMDLSQTDPKTYGGGAQDNGTNVTTTGIPDTFFEILGGDGGWIVFDPADASHVYASYYNMGIYRFRAGANPVDVSPPASSAEQNSIWMCYITMDPANANIVYTGSGRVWQTKNDGDTWEPISPVLDGSAISAIEVAPADSKRIYVGTENGGFFRSLDQGKTWSANLASAMLPGHMITRIDTTGKLGSDVLFATVANFGHSHVFCSRNGGITWQDMDRGQLPDVPHHGLAILPDDPNKIVVCNDIGVFMSADQGITWKSISRNLPNVMIIDLVYLESEKTLYAASYGRSLWKLKL